VAAPPGRALRVVLDPGVLICALLSPRGAPARLYLLWLGGEFELVVCPHLLAELEGVLRRPRFRDLAAPDEVGEFVDVIRQGAVWAENLVIAEAINRDPGDDYPSPWPRPPMSTTWCPGTRTSPASRRWCRRCSRRPRSWTFSKGYRAPEGCSRLPM